MGVGFTGFTFPLPIPVCKWLAAGVVASINFISLVSCASHLSFSSYTCVQLCWFSAGAYANTALRAQVSTFVLMGATVTMGFVLAHHLALGHDLSQFRSLSFTSLSLYRMLLGDDAYVEVKPSLLAFCACIGCESCKLCTHAGARRSCLCMDAPSLTALAHFDPHMRQMYNSDPFVGPLLYYSWSIGAYSI